MLLERSFIAIEQGNFRFSLGILDFWGLGGVFYGILKFPKIRHCEALKKEGAISKNSSFYFRNSSFLGVRGFFF